MRVQVCGVHVRWSVDVRAWGGGGEGVRLVGVFGKVGADGYLFVDEDGTGISAIIQLTGLKECPSISMGEL